MGTCRQLPRGVDSGLDNTSDNNTSGIILDGTGASGSMFDNIGDLWKQYPPVVILSINYKLPQKVGKLIKSWS